MWTCTPLRIFRLLNVVSLGSFGPKEAAEAFHVISLNQPTKATSEKASAAAEEKEEKWLFFPALSPCCLGFRAEALKTTKCNCKLVENFFSSKIDNGIPVKRLRFLFGRVNSCFPLDSLEFSDDHPHVGWVVGAAGFFSAQLCAGECFENHREGKG